MNRFILKKYLHIYISFFKYFYKRRLKLCFGDRIAVLSDI